MNPLLQPMRDHLLEVQDYLRTISDLKIDAKTRQKRTLELSAEVDRFKKYLDDLSTAERVSAAN